MQFYKIFYIAERTQTERESERERKSEGQTVHKICWIYILKTFGRGGGEGGRRASVRKEGNCYSGMQVLLV